ncbi:uncharacterized protein LOC120158175 [Hibiscus syriacus]|uniref:uncharacterized protein LOC120158175 n=1 Tax=Hibiscus syriacus TaxID=106335 RepID=UPI00192277F2|nr:uncharacterized protein LOC120158175 [Hibiscus syriacus]
MPAIFCKWIKTCITTPLYFVSLNGSLVGFFKGERGIRQGYPLFPYLFVIAINVMSSLLDTAANKGIFKFHPKYKRISLTHLCFADDLLVFCYGSVDDVLGVQNTLEKFYELSGLKLNAQKTEFFACGLNEHTVEQICRAAGFSTCCLLLIRNILANDGSLWIAWIKEYCFKSTSYWEVVCKPHFSWILSQMLRLKEETRTLFLPCANWSIITGKWIWDIIRISREKVVWHRLIWFPAHIPKISLISWMAILDRLPTKDRLTRFGLIVDNVCGLCGTGMESRVHLFADCSYAKDVWDSFLIACGLSHEFHSWDELLHWLLVNLKGKSIRVRILKLAWTGYLYFIWKERNFRHYRRLACSAEVTVNKLREL